MRALLALLLVLALPVAIADEITLTCTPPTQNEDGSALTDLAGIRFYQSQTSGGPYALVGDEQVCGLILDRGPGTYYFVATAYNDSGVESRYSNETSKTVAGPSVPPEPPTSLTAELDTVVYAISQSVDRVVLYPVGVLTENVECDYSQEVLGYHLVPQASVAFVEGSYARTVFARCSAG